LKVVYTRVGLLFMQDTLQAQYCIYL